MVKKKQPDFQKTKLKPGNIRPRGRNVTRITYKAKRITVRNKPRKVKSELTIQDCLSNACRHSSPIDSRKESLNQLKNLIFEQKDTFSVYTNEIITGMRGFLFENDESLNNGAIKVLEAVLILTDDLKISGNFPYLMNLLACAMTHTESKVKGVSLRLLDLLLQTHPKLTCHSLIFLKYLQGLLSGPSYNTKSRKKVQNSNLLISSGDTIYSQDWRFQVLALMNLFLKALLKNIKGEDDEKEQAKEEEDNLEKEVQWNRDEGPLHLELFAGSGLKPADIEKFDPSKFKTDDYDLEVPHKVHEFVDGIMDVLAQIYIEEITDGTAKADDDLIRTESINNLNILFQVLCYLGEWVTILNNSDCEFNIDMQKSFSKNLSDKIFKNICKFPFIPRGTVFESKPQLQYKFLPCVQLNLAVCYLYCAYVLRPESNSDNFRHQVIGYVQGVLKMPYEVKYDSLPLILKIMKIFLSFNKGVEVLKSEDLNEMMDDMTRTLNIQDSRPYQKRLISFFVDMSLEVGPNFLDCTDKLYMEHWYTQLLVLLGKMAQGNDINKKFLKDIRVIAIRRHPYFLNSLSKMRVSTIKGLLLHENDDIKETAIYLIYNMPKFPWELMQELTDAILGPNSFPQEKAITLIQLITPKFADPSVSAEDRVNFAGFLLNLAVDSINLDNGKWQNYDLPEFKKAWEPCNPISLYNILPSLHWKEHSKLFEICFHSLSQLPSSTVREIAKDVFSGIMSENRKNLPVHSAIAMLKLNKFGMEGANHNCLMEDLNFACMLFISVFTSLTVNDEWYKWNVGQVMANLGMTRQKAVGLLKHMQYNTAVQKEGITVHYLLRILKYLTNSQMVHVEDRDVLLSMFHEWKKSCVDENIDRQPLFIKLYDAFCYEY